MRAPQHYSGKAKQRGAALMVMLVIMVMGSAAFLVGSLGSSALKTARQETTVAALAQAKEALIGYVASDTVRPGELPCPDINDDGVINISGPDADYSGSNCISLIGRLPWRTLGLPDLRDAAGERLWYAVSDPFHANSIAVLNSNTSGTLSVSGNLSASNVIAIVFAPGQPLPVNDRTAANINNYSYSLESVVTAPTSFNLLTPDDQPGGNHTYNDQLRLITHDDLFPSAEKIVGNEIKKNLNTYYAAWGAFPFPAPFADPSTSSFVGSSSAPNGLLPRASTATPANLAVFPVWRNASFTSSATGGTVSGDFVMKTGTQTNSSWRYENMVITGTPTITITGILDNVGFGLWPPYDPTTTQISVRVGGSYYPASDPTYGMTNVSVQGALQSDGSALVTFKGTVQAGNIPDRIRFKDLRPCVYQSTYCPSTSTTWPSWIGANNWDHVIYYATSPGFVSGGGSACTPLPGTPPSCLTVNGSSGGNDKRATVVMTGRALSGQAHPQSTIANYLEGENTTPADFIYENKTRSSTFNDQVIVVAP